MKIHSGAPRTAIAALRHKQSLSTVAGLEAVTSPFSVFGRHAPRPTEGHRQGALYDERERRWRFPAGQVTTLAVRRPASQRAFRFVECIDLGHLRWTRRGRKREIRVRSGSREDCELLVHTTVFCPPLEFARAQLPCTKAYHNLGRPSHRARHPCPANQSRNSTKVRRVFSAVSGRSIP